MKHSEPSIWSNKEGVHLATGDEYYEACFENQEEAFDFIKDLLKEIKERFKVDTDFFVFDGDGK